jgi:hypothetical protein
MATELYQPQRLFSQGGGIVKNNGTAPSNTQRNVTSADKSNLSGTLSSWEGSKGFYDKIHSTPDRLTNTLAGINSSFKNTVVPFIHYEQQSPIAVKKTTVL